MLNIIFLLGSPDVKWYAVVFALPESKFSFTEKPFTCAIICCVLIVNVSVASIFGADSVDDP